jgi:CBS domain-containing protein
MVEMVRDLMRSPVRVVGKDETIAHARNILLRERMSRLVVIDKNAPIGILTKKDVLKALSNFNMRHRELDSISVKEVMRSPVKTIKESALIGEAAKLMVTENVRGLPVVDESNALVGMLTKTDLTQYFSEHFKGKHSVRDILDAKREIPTVHRSHTIYRVIDQMDIFSTDRVIVVEDDKPIGMITETDLSFVRPYQGESYFKNRKTEIEHVAPSRIYMLPTAEDIMASNPISILQSEDSAAAAEILVENGIGGMPVVDKDDKLIGMLTKFDFVRVIANEVK